MKSVPAVLLLVLASVQTVWALPVGAPGFALEHDNQRVAISAGAGYTYRQVEGEDFEGQSLYDNERSFRFLIRTEVKTVPWFTPSLYLGMADRSRKLTEYTGALGLLAGFGARFDPLIQTGSSGIGIALVPQFSYEKSSGEGLVFAKDADGKFILDEDTQAKTTVSRQQTATTYHSEVSLLISRKDDRICVYGGPKFDYDYTTYSKRDESVTGTLPIGLVIGLDYDITPQIFFSAEMENFHQDALYGMVGGRF